MKTEQNPHKGWKRNKRLLTKKEGQSLKLSLGIKTITFYRDNRVDSPFDLMDIDLIDKFYDWRESHQSMRNSWPLDRQIGTFLMDVGTFDEADRETIFDILRLNH